MDRTAEEKINKLLLKCEKCKVECTVKKYRKFDCSTAHDAGIDGNTLYYKVAIRIPLGNVH